MDKQILTSAGVADVSTVVDALAPTLTKEALHARVAGATTEAELDAVWADAESIGYDIEGRLFAAIAARRAVLGADPE